MNTEKFIQLLIESHNNAETTVDHVETTVTAITGILQSLGDVVEPKLVPVLLDIKTDLRNHFESFKNTTK